MRDVPNVLIKGSDDVTEQKEFREFVIKKAKTNYVVVICDSKKKINFTLEAAGFEIQFDELGRRINTTLNERMIIRNILEHEEKILQDAFVGKGIVVKAPILYAGSVLCPIDGNDLVKSYEVGFEEVFVFTTKEQATQQSYIFRKYPKIQVFGI
ncbi:MAG: hypothetical protein CR972_02930 [Candidatus Moraniibacteriota bacterium]|nr:MAG: hypothetical protein CR972_02930 [Candidatus Moranbacteria bacterium]